MSDLVRVRETRPDGVVVEHNEGRARAIAKGLVILDEPTHRHGNPRPTIRVGGRPVKPKTTVAKKAAAKKAAVIEPAPDEKE